jgi:DNA-binding GntR family transcriptional regulator
MRWDAGDAGDPDSRYISTLHQENLRVQVVRALRAALEVGELRPGVIYSGVSLAQRFGVSATPVREAMLDLAREGMVEPVRNRGFRVVEISDDDLDQVNEVRRLLEVPMMSRVVTLLRPEDFDLFTDLAKKADEAARGDDLIHYLEVDKEFHLRLISVAGNRQLNELVTMLRSKALIYGLLNLAHPEELMVSAAEHWDLLAALRAGDRPAVEDLVGRHIGAWGRRPKPALPLAEHADQVTPPVQRGSSRHGGSSNPVAASSDAGISREAGH